MREESATVCICTYNSEGTLGRCLASVRRCLRNSRIVVVDHYSNDKTADIARIFEADVYYERISLGHARQMCLELTETEYIVFVDSDVEILRTDFLDIARKALKQDSVGAVVGLARDHRFAYGLPASLLVLRKRDFGGKVVPDFIDARETYFLQQRLNQLGLKTSYVFDAMVHDSRFREFKMEWEGANTRIAAGISVRELFFTFEVILFMALNSRKLKNIFYVPVSYLKFLRGFIRPNEWRRLNRTLEVAGK